LSQWFFEVWVESNLDAFLKKHRQIILSDITILVKKVQVLLFQD
jgi:hypothetical protein